MFVRSAKIERSDFSQGFGRSKCEKSLRSIFFGGIYVLNSPTTDRDVKPSVSIGEKVDSMFDLLPPAPITPEAADQVGMAMYQLTQGKGKIKDPEALRQIMLESFKTCGYSFSKTVENIAENPKDAYINGGWTAFILGMVADLSDEQIKNIYAEKEASAIFKLRQAMKTKW